MKNTFLDARLVAPDMIRVLIFSSNVWSRIYPRLQTDYVHFKELSVSKTSTMSGLSIYDFHLEKPLELGHSYQIILESYGVIPLDVSEATSFPNFDEEYFYNGDDLGAVYSPKETTFALWAPLASSVLLKWKDPKEKDWNFSKMERSKKGVYRSCLTGDHEGLIYRYIITNSEHNDETTDPYAKGSTLNGAESVVVDFSKLQTNFHREALPVLNSPTDSVIYEAHVRDMTIDPHSDIKHKGTFLGLSETNRHTKKGHPAGFDYLVNLGITHLQLLPIYDYKTVDESNPASGYNWGYDPAQYFVPEGSYASDLKDPLSRIVDLKNMVAAFHQKGIRIVMDVVYNHVYEYSESVFEKVVPNFYFRRKSTGMMANTSGCKSDVASERPMVRKMIIDACRFWIEEYGIDGFRFDLMGINDVQTLNEIAKMAKKHDPSFILYGEGWNMGGEVNVPLGHYGNANLLPDFGFFNDQYRESLKKSLIGDEEARHVYKSAYCASCVDFTVPARFLNAKQSINYVECHDNETLYDFLTQKLPYDKTDKILDLVKAANAMVLFSFGIPFIHMGQEIAMSKWGEGNTYNKGDGYNKFSYTLLDERYDMVEYFISAVSLRKKTRFLHVYDPRVMDQLVDISDFDQVLKITYRDPNLVAPYLEFEVFANFNDHDAIYEENADHRLEFDQKGALANPKKVRKLLIPKRSVIVTAACDEQTD